jgi:uncharacterized protein
MQDSKQIQRSSVIRETFVLALGVGLASCSFAAGDTCLTELSGHRTKIDADFMADEDPLSKQQKLEFTGLNYYPGDPEYCIRATFSVKGKSEVFDMPTFNEKSIPFREYGTFRFRLHGVDHMLAAYQRMDLPDKDRQWVLIPFGDATNGIATYGGGRYISIDLPIEAGTTIDFNRAFNPWCAYNSKYLCPIPPAKNELKLSIEAGEKLFKAP